MAGRLTRALSAFRPHRQGGFRVRAPGHFLAATLIAFCALPLLPACEAQGHAPTTRRAGYILQDGTIRIVGSANMKGAIEALATLYEQQHQGVHFRYEASDDNGAIDALIFDASPFAPVDTIYGGGIAYSDIVKAAPLSIRIAHASLKPGAQVSPLAVIVNPANPAGQLNMTVVASMFTKQLRARVLATWAQAGVVMPAAAQQIAPAGLPWSDHYASEDRAFADDVFFRKFSGAPPVDSYLMFKTYAEVVDFVAREPAAVGLVEASRVTPAVKVVALVDGPFNVASRPNAADVSAGKYPLDRYLYLNLRNLPGMPLDTLAHEFVRLALSPQGQAAIASEAQGYLPLNPLELAEELSKLP